MGWQDAPIEQTAGPVTSLPPLPSGESGNLADALYSGLTFGYGDEVSGALSGAISKLTGGDYQPAYERTRDYVRARNADYAEKYPIRNIAGNIAGGLATPVGIFGDVLAARPIVSAAGLGTVAGFGEGKGGVENRLENAAIGGGVGTATGGALKGISNLSGMVFPTIAARAGKPDFQRAVANLKANDIPVTAAEIISSPQGRLAERAAGGYFGFGDNISNRPFALYSKLMSHANFAPEDIELGELSQDAVRRAQQRFSQGYDKALTGLRVNLPDMEPALGKIEGAYGTLVPFEQRSRLSNVIDDFRQLVDANRNIGGKDYQRLRSHLGTLQERTANSPSDSYLPPVYRSLRNALDDAFHKAAPPETAAQVKALNSQYGAFKLLQQAEGNPEAIDTLANSAWRNGRRVSPEFVRLARDYQGVFLRGKYASSGSPENQAAISKLVPPVPAVLRSLGAGYQAHFRPYTQPLHQIPASTIAGLLAADSRLGQ